MRGISRLAEELLASQEEFCFVDLVFGTIYFELRTPGLNNPSMNKYTMFLPQI
jgi:hypothetical protein